MGSRGQPGSRAGFSLIELVGVLVILAALSVTVLPSLQRIEASRRAALAEEIERRLTLARASAMATGDAHAVRFQIDAGLVESLQIDEAGAEPSQAIGPTGSPLPPLEIAAAFPGASIASFTGGDPDESTDTIWFAYDGTPHVREDNGDYIGPFQQDAEIAVTEGRAIRVRRSTGLIEQDS